MKSCKTCGETKALDAFYKNKRMRDGHLNHCKPCFLDSERVRYEKGAEAKREYQRDYYWRNRDKNIEQNKRYRSLNQERIAEHKRQYREAHADEIREYNAQYKRENPDVVRMHRRRRKVRERGMFVVDITAADRAAKLDMFGHRCVYCACDLTPLNIHWDHWKPLSKGGLHVLSNLYPSCSTCNMSKSAKWPFKAPVNYARKQVDGEALGVL